MLKEDYELTREDIQSLSSRDALTAFFAKLGYDTNVRLVQHAAAMGITSDSLASAITHIERLANRGSAGFLLEIYLFELKSVTVAHTQNIVRAFRNRPGDYLLVLTDDYQRLDFVLVERYSADLVKPQDSGNVILSLPAAPRQVGVRPRVLTVQRLKPGDVELRVLRRFSYTESDTFAQYDKLLSAYDVADWSEPFFNNRALFSDYYLTRRLPESPEWKDPTEAAAMTRAFKQLRQLYAGVRETFSNQSEETVRARLLEPVLNILGFTPQSVKPPTDNTAAPDYKLYAISSPVESHDIGTLLALCLAYTWGRSLDGKDELRDNLTPDENPGAVVVSLLDSGEADWAIVTNGKTWRLYSAKAHSRATNYYEIDLEETLALPAANLEYAFPYFWHFFRAAAFLPAGRALDGETRQLCFLDTLVSESERYARELGERLKKRVFEDIFPHFARGFIIYARRTGQLPPGMDTLPAAERDRLLEPFFSGTLTFLYRLLFLLYAESRDLLPVREARGYREKSLEKLKWQIAEKAGAIEDSAPEKLKAAYNELSTAFYDRLQELFQAVDKGEPSLNVPVYNGGLFVTQPDPADTSPEAAVAHFLSTCKIPDRQLALGLDRMARDLDEKRHDLAFIDYKSLGVRQLGSIYEGLLEFKLRIAPEVMAIVKGKKTEETVPYVEAQQQKLPILKEGRGKDAYDKTLPKGAVYLENDRRERKASGSYYTPDYIVKYIVEHTVGPILDEKLEALRPLFRDAEKTLRTEREKARALRRDDISPEHETYKKFRDTLNDTFFDIKVLDPAMGSGHFLVEAVDYITDRVADFLTAFRWNPVIYELAQTRREIQQGMEQQGVTIDMSKLTDLNLLKRRVLKSCIYGVDLNPMAVELAKVSLWLDCFTLGAPLSFLDHHMKCGNSLIGGSVQEVEEAVSIGLWGSQFIHLLGATQMMRKVSELSDVTALEIAASRAAYKGAYDALAPFKRLLDVWTSEQFAIKGAKRITQDNAGAIYHNDYSETDKGEKQVIVTALSLATTKRFFHWELEFPEVFFDETKRKDNGGFDAVVGNPPYIRIQEMVGADSGQLKFFSETYIAAKQNYDIYSLFAEKGFKLIKGKASISGRAGLILPNKFFTVDYGRGLRQFLADNRAIACIIDFDAGQVFSEVTTYTCLLFLSGAITETFPYYRLPLGQPIESSLQLAVRDATLIFNTSLSGEEPWLFSQLDENEIIISLEKSCERLDQVTERIFQGLKTSADKIYIVEIINRTNNEIDVYSSQLETQHTVEVGLWHPLIKGGDSNRFDLNPSNLAILFPYAKVSDGRVRLISESQIKKDYPKTYAYLLANKAYLENRENGKMHGSNWYAYIYPKALDIMHLPKLFTPDFAPSASFSLDSSGEIFFTGGASGGYGILVKQDWNQLYILTLLNSKLLDWRLSKHTTTFRGGWRSYESRFISELPIRRINFTLSPEQRAYYLEKARNLYAYCLDKNDQDCVLGFVDHHLSREPEESDVVHDLLAMLAEEMIRLNKEKRAAQRDFLDWLVATLKILPDKDGRKGIDVLTGKGKVLDYPGDYQKGEPPLATGELLDILQKNRGRLGVSLSDSALLDRIKREYEVSLERVLPLKERLAQTDRLIDAVVYRLYGLTEEEVAVVEGRG